MVWVGVRLGVGAVRVTVSVAAASISCVTTAGLDSVCAGSDILQATAASANITISEKDMTGLFFTTG